MKITAIASLLTCFITSTLIQAAEPTLNTKKTVLLNAKTTISELTILRAKEALLNDILKKSEFIQLRNGDMIDLRHLEDVSAKLRSNILIQDFIAREGGTGAGG